MKNNTAHIVNDSLLSFQIFILQIILVLIIQGDLNQIVSEQKKKLWFSEVYIFGTRIKIMPDS
jgi:hypothetical protein